MSKLTPIAVVCAAVTAFTAPVAQADALFNSRGVVEQTAQGGFAGRSAGARGDRGALGRRQGITADGQGNARGAAQEGFTTDSGAYGARGRSFDRSADGAVSASGQGRASGSNGSAERSGSFTRDADGTASGEHRTTATNANTGVTFDANTTYSKGSGVSRSASCADAAGNAVDCLSR